MKRSDSNLDDGIKRFQAKWNPVRVKKTLDLKKLERVRTQNR